MSSTRITGFKNQIEAMKNVKLLKDALGNAAISADGLKAAITEFIAINEATPRFSLEGMVDKKEVDLQSRSLYYRDGYAQAVGNGGATAARIRLDYDENVEGYHVDVLTGEIYKGLQPFEFKEVLKGQRHGVDFDAGALKRLDVQARANKSEATFIKIGDAHLNAVNLKHLLPFLRFYPNCKLYVGDVFEFVDDDQNQFLAAVVHPEKVTAPHKIISL